MVFFSSFYVFVPNFTISLLVFNVIQQYFSYIVTDKLTITSVAEILLMVV